MQVPSRARAVNSISTVCPLNFQLYSDSTILFEVYTTALNSLFTKMLNYIPESVLGSITCFCLFVCF